MPYKEPEIKKMYYPIGEVAKMFRVSVSLIRFWENEFDILKPKKNRKGNRLFTPADVENLKKIYQYVKVEGYTLEGAKKKLQTSGNSQAEDNYKSILISSLKEIKTFLTDLQSNL